MHPLRVIRRKHQGFALAQGETYAPQSVIVPAQNPLRWPFKARRGSQLGHDHDVDVDEWVLRQPSAAGEDCNEVMGIPAPHLAALLGPASAASEDRNTGFYDPFGGTRDAHCAAPPGAMGVAAFERKDAVAREDEDCTSPPGPPAIPLFVSVSDRSNSCRLHQRRELRTANRC